MACHFERGKFGLERERTPEAAEHLLRSFLLCPEASQSLGQRLYRENIGTVLFRDGPMRFVVSLGTHCYTSSALIRQQLKRFSGRCPAPRAADSGASRPPFRNDVAHLFRDYSAHRSEMISPTIPG